MDGAWISERAYLELYAKYEKLKENTIVVDAVVKIDNFYLTLSVLQTERLPNGSVSVVVADYHLEAAALAKSTSLAAHSL